MAVEDFPLEQACSIYSYSGTTRCCCVDSLRHAKLTKDTHLSVKKQFTTIFIFLTIIEYYNFEKCQVPQGTNQLSNQI